MGVREHLLSQRMEQTTSAKSRHFLLLSTARSGSTLLMDLLNNHPMLKCHSEPLNEEILTEKDLLKATKSEILEHIRTILNQDNKPVVGLKMLIEQLRDTGIDVGDVLGEMKNPRVIILYRPNILETYVSLSIANSNEKWYSTVEPNTDVTEVDWSDFLDYSTDRRALWRACVSEVQQLVEADDWVSVSYDTLCGDMTGMAQKLFQFLGLWKMETPIHHYSIKQNPGSLKNKIKNFDEVSEHLCKDIKDLLTLEL